MTKDKKLKAMAEYLADYLDEQPTLNTGAILSGIKDFKLAFDVAKIQFMADDKQYRIEQFMRVATEYKHYQPKLMVIKPDDATNWLSITENELQAIIELLT